MIEKGIRYLLHITKPPPELIVKKNYKKPFDLILLGIWGLSYLRQRALGEIVDAENRLSRFKLKVEVDPIFEKITERVAVDPLYRKQIAREFKLTKETYDDEVDRIAVAPMVTVKQWFGDYLDIEEDFRGIDPELEKKRIAAARKELNEIDKYLRKVITPFFNERIKQLKRQRFNRKRANEKIDDIKYNLKRNLGKAVAEYIVWHGKTIRWMKELFHISERIAGLSSGPERAVEKQLSALIRSYYKKYPIAMGNISTINATRISLEKRRAYQPEFKVAGFIYYSSKPLALLATEEYSNFLNNFLVEITVRETDRQILIDKTKSLKQEANDIVLRLKTEDLSDKQRDSLSKKYTNIQKKLADIPSKIRDAEMNIKLLSQAYQDFKDAQGDENKIKELKRKPEYRKLMGFDIKPPREPYVSWWRTKDGQSLIFPNMATEYQYFYSLFVKRGKKGLIKGLKGEFFKPIKYLPRYSLWSKSHLSQVSRWFGEEFFTLSEGAGKGELSSIKMFDFAKLMPKIRRLASGEGIREVDRKFLDDIQSALFMIRRSLDNDFMHDPLSGKELSELYRLTKNDILPYPPDWNPGLKTYNKKEIDNLLADIENIQKQFSILESERAAEMKIKKKPEQKEKEFNELTLNHRWRIFKKYPDQFKEFAPELADELINRFSIDFLQDIKFYCTFKYPVFIKGQMDYKHLYELPQKYKKTFVFTKPWGQDLKVIENALIILYGNNLKKLCNKLADPEIIQFFKDYRLAKSEKKVKTRKVKIKIPGTDKEEEWEEEIVEWWPGKEAKK